MIVAILILSNSKWGSFIDKKNKNKKKGRKKKELPLSLFSFIILYHLFISLRQVYWKQLCHNKMAGAVGDFVVKHVGMGGTRISRLRGV